MLGFNIAYFLVFHVRSLLWQIGLFLLCTVPFWTSNIIRMISWIPFLGRNGIFNQTLMGLGITTSRWTSCCSRTSPWSSPTSICSRCSWSCRSSTRWRGSIPALIEAARDAGAGRWRDPDRDHVPLSKTGIALGSIFVVTLVMGDFFVVQAS